MNSGFLNFAARTAKYERRVSSPSKARKLVLPVSISAVAAAAVWLGSSAFSLGARNNELSMAIAQNREQDADQEHRLRATEQKVSDLREDIVRIDTNVSWIVRAMGGTPAEEKSR